MKKLNLLISTFILIFLTNISIGQTVIYSEDFTTGSSWTLNTVVGAEGSNPNVWYISCKEIGEIPGTCGNACSSTGDNSLHISADAGLGGDIGAAYGETGFSITSTNRRAESGNISTVGQTNLTLSFDMIGFGGNSQDYCELFYSTDGGVTWVSLATPLTSQCCDGSGNPITCTGTDQGLWQNNTYVLPSACENIPNLRISFVWKNVDDGIATDPSFAVDDIAITTPSASTSVTADFTLNPASPICAGTSVTFTDASTASGTTINSWNWNFDATGVGGASPSTANTQGPQSVTFNTAGTYDISLTVGNGTITDTKTVSLVVNAAANAGADNTANVCNNGGSTTLDLNTLLSGADAGGTWTETSTTPSGQFIAATGMFDGNGLATGNTYTFDYTVTGTAPCPNDVATMTITIIDCSSGTVTANFNVDQTTICQGQTITFTDASTASGTTINSWAWNFDATGVGGASPSTANTQGPHTVTYNTAGTYDVELTVSDGTLSDTKTIQVTVNPSDDATFSYPNSTYCLTDPDPDPTLTGLPGGMYTYTTVSGGPNLDMDNTDGHLFLATSQVGVYDVTYTTNGPCPSTFTFQVTIQDCSSGTVTADFNADQTTICQGQNITFTDASTASGTTINSWAWNFDATGIGGATPSTANTQGPHTVTYNTAGTYDVELTVGDGTNTDVKTIQVTVNPLPNVTATASPSTTLCTGDQLTLTGGGASSYTWDNGVVDGVAFPVNSQGSTVYTVIGTDANGCTNLATVTVNVSDCAPLVAGFSFQDDICVGDCITFTDTSSGNVASWQWDFGPNATPPTSTDQDPGEVCFNTVGVQQIQLTITDAAGNSVSVTNNLTVHDVPTVHAELDTIIDLGGNVDLIATSPNFGSYQWTPSTYYIDCDTCATTFATPALDVDYIVIFTDPNGCTAQDTVSVIVNFIEGIGVPQAFSPNGDGHNDLLVVKGLGIEKMVFKIYNRYGELVFESHEQTFGWDGTYKGKDENPGVFTWVLEYHLLNGTSKIISGNTTLIR